MNARSLSSHSATLPPPWRQRLWLLFIIACFALPLAAAWLLVGHWRPSGSVQHGELLSPTRLVELRYAPLSDVRSGSAVARGRWVLVYLGSATGCDDRCRNGLYTLRQTRLALGRDLERVTTLVLVEDRPATAFRHWLAVEHPAMTVGLGDAATRSDLLGAFPQPGRAGEWFYLLDPLGNLVMRYPIDTEPRGLLQDLQRLLKWSKIG